MANTEMLIDGGRASAQAADSTRVRVARRAGAAGLVRDLVALTKPRITLMVVLTSAAGMWLAPGRVGTAAFWLSMIGTSAIVASANALNMWWERDVDGKMARTQNRPLPAGRLAPNVALAFGLALAVVSVPMLFAVNVTTAVLGLIALVTYVAIYTPMKRVSWMALLVGAVPGAMPPLMGWTTVTGHAELGGVLLFGVLFLWQVPHFGAITLFRTQDYARAGLQVLAVQRGERVAKRVIVGYAALLVANTLLFYPCGLAGARYLAVAIACGAAFLGLTIRGFFPGAGTKWAKLVFGCSILYLMVVLAALLLDRVVV